METPPSHHNPSLERRRKADRTLRKVVMITTISLAVIVIGALGLLFTFILPRHKTIEIYNEPMPVDKLEYHRGDLVSYELEYHKFTDNVATIGRQMVCELPDNKQYAYTQGQGLSGIQKTPDDVHSVTLAVTAFQVPEDAPFSRPCKVTLIFKYEFNPLNVQYVRTSTKTFEIVPANVPRRKAEPIQRTTPTESEPADIVPPNRQLIPEDVTERPLTGVTQEKKKECKINLLGLICI